MEVAVAVVEAVVEAVAAVVAAGERESASCFRSSKMLCTASAEGSCTGSVLRPPSLASCSSYSRNTRSCRRG